MKKQPLELITLKTREGPSISWEIDKDGNMNIDSTLPADETMALIPLIWPAWMFEKK